MMTTTTPVPRAEAGEAASAAAVVADGDEVEGLK